MNETWLETAEAEIPSVAYPEPYQTIVAILALAEQQKRMVEQQKRTADALEHIASLLEIATPP